MEKPRGRPVTLAMTAFGEWLQQELDRREINRAELARRAGIHSSTVNKWFTGGPQGTVRPSPHYCSVIADVLMIPEDEVLIRAGHRRRDIAPKDSLRREAQNLIDLIPEPFLPVVIASLRGVANSSYQATTLDRMKQILSESPDATDAASERNHGQTRTE